MIPNGYLPNGKPWPWDAEKWPEIGAAVRAYSAAAVHGEAPPTPEQIQLIVGYLLYYFNAPAWEYEFDDEASRTTLDTIMGWTIHIATVRDVTGCLVNCDEFLSLEPLEGIERPTIMELEPEPEAPELPAPSEPEAPTPPTTSQTALFGDQLNPDRFTG